MISDQYKCIHIHIPRTGGSSIESVLWPDNRKESDLWMGFVDKVSNKYQTDGLQHLTAKKIKEIDSRFNDYWKFAIVRNPWDKMVDEWIYLKTKKRLLEFLGLKKWVGLKEFIELSQQKPHTHWMPQVDFITENGQVIVDYIGKFEEYEKVFREIMVILGKDIDNVPHKNKLKREHYKNYYDKESEEMIFHYYKKDIEAFGYEY